jgi:hypothetical protein
MGLNDGFLDMMACPSCGEKVLMRLQIKIDGVDMHDYRPGRPVTSKVLESVRRNEAEFIDAVRRDFAIPEADLSDIGLESADGSFAVVGSARCVGGACKCGQSPRDASCVVVVDRGTFRGFSPELPKNGPIVTDHGMVLPRWMLRSETLRSGLLEILGDFFEGEL